MKRLILVLLAALVLSAIGSALLFTEGIIPALKAEEVSSDKWIEVQVEKEPILIHLQGVAWPRTMVLGEQMFVYSVAEAEGEADREVCFEIYSFASCELVKLRIGPASWSKGSFYQMTNFYIPQAFENSWNPGGGRISPAEGSWIWPGDIILSTYPVEDCLQ